MGINTITLVLFTMVINYSVSCKGTSLVRLDGPISGYNDHTLRTTDILFALNSSIGTKFIIILLSR